jgi:hypothetical protein
MIPLASLKKVLSDDACSNKKRLLKLYLLFESISTTLSIMTFSIMQSIDMLSVTHKPFTLSVIMPNDIMQSVQHI